MVARSGPSPTLTFLAASSPPLSLPPSCLFNVQQLLFLSLLFSSPSLSSSPSFSPLLCHALSLSLLVSFAVVDPSESWPSLSLSLSLSLSASSSRVVVVPLLSRLASFELTPSLFFLVFIIIFSALAKLRYRFQLCYRPGSSYFRLRFPKEREGKSALSPFPSFPPSLSFVQTTELSNVLSPPS